MVAVGKGRRLRLAAVLALLVAGLTPASAAAFTKAIWGPVYRNGVNQFPLYRTLGVGIDEASLNWAVAAPTRPRRATDPTDPAYRWPLAVQQLVTQAKRYHVAVLLQLITTPRWANHGGAANVPPINPWDYAAFAKAAAREFPSVHLWMIWGEPSRTANFSLTHPVAPGQALTPAQQVAPHTYAQLLDDAYSQLKSVSARNLVLGGSTWSGGDIDTQQWIENLRLPNGHRPRMDIYAHNPFSNVAPSFSVPFSARGIVQFSDLPEDPAAPAQRQALCHHGGRRLRRELARNRLASAPDRWRARARDRRWRRVAAAPSALSAPRSTSRRRL